MRRLLTLLMAFLVMAVVPLSAGASSANAVLKTLPVLDEGRIKPLDTFAREFAVRVTGGESCAGMDHMELLLFFMLNPEKAARRPLIYIRSAMLREKLALPLGKTHFAVSDIAANEQLKKILRAGTELSAQGVVFEEAYELWRLLARLADMGRELRIIPPSPGAREWRTLAQIKGTGESSLKDVTAAFSAMKDAYISHDEAGYASAAGKFVFTLKKVNPAAWPDETVLSLEVLNNEVRPFQKAWILYLAGFCVLLFLLVFTEGRIRLIALMPILAALLLHTGGLCARAIIAGRVPLGDMFESVVFMGWGAMVLGLVFGAICRRIYIACIAALVVGLALLAAGPGDGPGVVPLVISNSTWLAVHVATIVMGYSAFALAAGLAHYGWGIYCFAPGKDPLFKSVANYIYRILQIGVLFLVVGTAMGGVWANESWGRFWGWDPKETWAMITILVYMAILHARRCGWLREFGVVVGSILGFLVVLMTWYGVNYLLGTGLHSYGFGGGSRGLVLPILAAELLIVFIAFTYRSARLAVFRK